MRTKYLHFLILMMGITTMTTKGQDVLNVPSSYPTTRSEFYYNDNLVGVRYSVNKETFLIGNNFVDENVINLKISINNGSSEEIKYDVMFFIAEPINDSSNWNDKNLHGLTPYTKNGQPFILPSEPLDKKKERITNMIYLLKGKIQLADGMKRWDEFTMNYVCKGFKVRIKKQTNQTQIIHKARPVALKEYKKLLELIEKSKLE